VRIRESVNGVMGENSILKQNLCWGEVKRKFRGDRGGGKLKNSFREKGPPK